jgi:hypothetical protein
VGEACPIKPIAALYPSARASNPLNQCFETKGCKSPGEAFLARDPRGRGPDAEPQPAAAVAWRSLPCRWFEFFRHPGSVPGSAASWPISTSHTVQSRVLVPKLRLDISVPISKSKLPVHALSCRRRCNSQTKHSTLPPSPQPTTSTAPPMRLDDPNAAPAPDMSVSQP